MEFSGPSALADDEYMAPVPAGASPHCPPEVLALLQGDGALPTLDECGRDATRVLSDAETPSLQSLTRLIDTGAAATSSGVFDFEAFASNLVSSDRRTESPVDSASHEPPAPRLRRASSASTAAARASPASTATAPPRSPARVSTSGSAAAAAVPPSPSSPVLAARLRRGPSLVFPSPAVNNACVFWQRCRERRWALSHVIARLQDMGPSALQHEVRQLLIECGSEPKLALRQLAGIMCWLAGFTREERHAMCERLGVPTAMNSWYRNHLLAVVRHMQVVLRTDEIPDIRQ
jgi:hypothetical protein